VKIDIYAGDCLDSLKQLEDQSINTCITSPPYWGLRDYNGEEKQLGLEDTPEEFVDNLVKVFREVKRVLRDDGTVWLNLGDSYNAGRNGGHAGGSKQNHKKYLQRSGANVVALKPKDLIGIPWRVALALQQDGWYLRQDIIWHKPNPMPESVRDRCTKAHEYIFLFSKSKKYYFDNEAIKEESVTVNSKGERGKPNSAKNVGKSVESIDGFDVRGGFKNMGAYEKRNKRSVWTVNTKPFKEAHFATFPPDLIKPCVLAGCPEKMCVDCGKPYIRQARVEKNLTAAEVKKIKEDIVKTNKIKKPYAIVEKEFRNQVVEYRDLPRHDKLRIYLKEYRSKSGITIDAIEEHFGTQAPHHWFEKGGSYPNKNDWIKLKKLLSLDDTYDQAMTEVFYKSGLKGDNNYVDSGFAKQCDCETNETKPGTVLDPFAGSGTTGIVAVNHNRNAVLLELNEEYIEIAKERINKQAGRQQ